MPNPLRIRARTLSDAPVGSSVATRFARDAGFDRRACTEIAIAVSELVTNSVRHARGSGEVEIRLVDDAIEVMCTDDGPGDVTTVRGSIASDLPSRPTGSGLGCGLGAVRRLMDEVEAGDRPGGGIWVRARRSRVRRGGIA